MDFIEDDSTISLAQEQFDTEEEVDETTNISDESLENVIYAKGHQDSENDPFAGF